MGIFGRNTGRKTVRPHFLPWLDVFFWLAIGPFTYWVRLVVWMLHIERAPHPGPGKKYFSLILCPLDLSMLVVG